MRWVYDGHLGTLYTTDKPMPQELLYCEQCGDYDLEMGGFATLEDFLIAYADVIQLPDSEEWGYYLEYIFAHSRTRFRIRAMNDEELAEFLCDFRVRGADEHPCKWCKAEHYCRAGHTGTIDWLQQPAEEDDHV